VPGSTWCSVVSEARVVVTEQRGMRFVAPGFVGVVCAAAVARVLFGGSPTTATVVAVVLIAIVGVACLVFCVWLARAGRAEIVATPADIRWVGAARNPANIDRANGHELILHITPTAFSRRGGQQYTWELVTPRGEQRIDLQHFDHEAVADACRRTGWAVTVDARPGRVPG
jgi:hypothetical protein